MLYGGPLDAGMMDSSKFPVLIATLLVPKLIEYFSLNASSIGALYPLVTIAISYLFNKFEFEDLNVSWYMIISIIALVYCIKYVQKDVFKIPIQLYEYIMKFFKKERKNTQITIKIFNKTDIETFSEYCQKHSGTTWNFNDIDQTIGNESHLKTTFVRTQLLTATSNVNAMNERNSYPVHGHKVPFDDDYLGIHGTYHWNEISCQIPGIKKTGEDEPEKIESIQLYPELRVTFKNADHICNARDLVQKMKMYLNELASKSRKIVIYSCLTSLHIDSSTKKVSGRQSDGQLLYTGKKLDIDYLTKIYLDTYFHQKKDIVWNLVKKVHFEPEFFYKFGQPASTNFIFYGPPGSGKSTFINRIARTLQRSIVSIDMKSMIEKRQLRDLLLNPYGVSGSYYSGSDRSSSHLNVNEVIYVFEEFDNYIKILVEDSKKQECSAQKSEDENVIVKFSLDTKMFDYDIKDLLDIFQGTVPVEGRIIIATTNDLEFIRNECPALIRDGRLTPVEFGYLEADVFDKMCMYFFNTTFEVPVGVIISTIPTSTLMNHIMHAKLNEDIDIAVHCFQQFLNSLQMNV